MNLTNKQKEMVEVVKGSLPTLPAEIAQRHVNWYPQWIAGEAIPANTRRADNGTLYENLHALNEGNNLYRPSETPAIWVRVWEEDCPEWVQPLGAHDAYAKDAKVTHNDKRWISEVWANVWEPGSVGAEKAWREVTE